MNALNFEELAPRIHVIDDCTSFFGVQAGHKMTVIQLSDESGSGLWIHSPIAFTEELWGRLDHLCDPGLPRHLVIPSRTHDLHLKEWMLRIPAETTFAPAAISRVHPGWRIGQMLTENLIAPWSAELPHHCLFGAPRVSEVDFLHVPSKTLILVDSVFNLRGKQSPIGELVMRLNRCSGGIATSLLFRWAIKDKKAFKCALSKILGWDFERVVVGHGEVIEGPRLAELKSHLAGLC